MRLFLRKMEALMMAATYAQAEDRNSALQCLQNVYEPQTRQRDRVIKQQNREQNRKQQQLRL